MKTLKRNVLGWLGMVALSCSVYAQPAPPPGGYQPPPPDPGYQPGPGNPYPNDPNYPPQPDQGYPSDPGSQPDQGYPPDQGYNGYPNGAPNQGYDQPYDGAPVDTSFFYNRLAPYGEWVQHPSYGWVWEPRGVPAGWRPYTRGHWAYTDDGWAWVSSEPWGWAAYHYGRWAYDPNHGWLWVPGNEWAPAWVTWQEGNGYLGWAPLPPRARWRAGFGLDLGGLNLGVDLSPWAFSFVPEREIFSSRVENVIEPSARNVTLVRNTRNITDYGVENGRVVHRGVPVNRVAQVVGRPIRPIHVESVTRGVPSRATGEQGDRVTFFRPNLRADATPRNVQPPAPRYRSAPPEQLTRRHQSEQQALDQYHQTQRQQLDQYHQRELSNAQAQQANRQQLQQRHQAEAEAMQQQQQRERQQLEARHQRERQGAQQAQRTRPPDQRQRPPQGRDNRDNRNQDNRDNRPPDQRPPADHPPVRDR